MKDNIPRVGYRDEPASDEGAVQQRDAVLAAVASLVIRDGFADIGLAELMKRLSFDSLAAGGLAGSPELASFYRTPDILLHALFDAMLCHLEARISCVAAGDTESLGRFERAYRTVISGRADLPPVTVSGLDGPMVSCLFFLFMSVMDHESRHGTSLTLQQRWMNWYSRQITRFDTPEGMPVAP